MYSLDPITRRDAAVAAVRSPGLHLSDDQERRGVRATYDVGHLDVEIDQPCGSTVSYSVIPRNLSTRGFAFAHGRFLYVGSPCRVHLRTLDGQTLVAPGRIITCRHLHGVCHEIIVLFDGPIDLSRFVELDGTERQRARDELRQNGEPQQERWAR
jgi:hypothetical protein